MRLTEAVAANTIEGITLDIFTYNDICENCFSTCDKQFGRLKASITDLFRLAKRADEHFAPTFNICISSFRPYQIAPAVLTRRLEEGYEPSSNIFDRAFCSVGDRTSNDPRIIQFVNPWIFGYLIQNELADITTAIGALRVEDLMKNIGELTNLTNRYGEIRDLVNTKQDYILTKFGYNLVINHNAGLEVVGEAINTKRATVRARAQELATTMDGDI